MWTRNGEEIVEINLSLALPEEVVQSARVVAEKSGRQVEAVLSEWAQVGLERQLVAALRAEGQVHVAEAALGEDERRDLADLFCGHHREGLSAREAERLDDLIHQYRRYLSGETRAVTDWLALGGARRAGSPVDHLITMRSSMLYAAGYDGEKQVLDVVFNSGGVYRYFDVPAHVYDGLLKAPSPGRYMWDHVLRVYPNVRLDRKRGTRRALSRQRRQIEVGTLDSAKAA